MQICKLCKWKFEHGESAVETNWPIMGWGLRVINVTNILVYTLKRRIWLTESRIAFYSSFSFVQSSIQEVIQLHSPFCTTTFTIPIQSYCQLFQLQGDILGVVNIYTNILFQSFHCLVFIWEVIKRFPSVSLPISCTCYCVFFLHGLWTVHSWASIWLI